MRKEKLLNMFNFSDTNTLSSNINTINNVTKKDNKKIQKADKKEANFQNSNHIINASSNGIITARPTNRNKTIIKIDKNPQLKNLQGAYDFGNIAKETRNKYKIKVDKADIEPITMYGEAEKQKKQIRQGQRKVVGNTITINDDTLGKKIYDTFAGNADVE